MGGIVDDVDPTIEVRRRIVARLSRREFITHHVGVAGHVDAVADAILEVFPVAFYIPGLADQAAGCRRYLAVRANAEATPA